MELVMMSACRVERLEEFEQRVVRLQVEFAAGDAATRRRLLQPAHAKERFENYDPDAPSLSDADARLLIANQEGYAYWGKYESYLHLDPAVQRVIVAVRSGDIETLRDILRADPVAANPRWGAGFHRPTPIPNDSIPLFCISEGVFRGTNTQHNAYDMTRMLVAAGGDIHIEGDIVLESAVSFDVIDAVAALLDSGADPAIRDEVYHSTPIGWACHFRQSDSVDLLIDRAGIHDAVGCDRPDRLRTLLAHDPGLANASDEDGGTPLHRLHGALTHGTEMLDLLLQHHADVNARDRRGVTVLANVMASGAADLAERLRSLGAN
jgi:Ankyrin repeat